MSSTQHTEAFAPAAGAAGRTRLTLGTLFRQWFNAFIESRTQKAELCIKEHIKFLPDDVLQRAGYRQRKADLVSSAESDQS
jgi:ribosomal protein S18 acetylase RimI-like enzyme